MIQHTSRIITNRFTLAGHKEPRRGGKGGFQNTESIGLCNIVQRVHYCTPLHVSSLPPPFILCEREGKRQEIEFLISKRREEERKEKKKWFVSRQISLLSLSL